MGTTAKTRRGKRKKLTSRNADRHDLYQRSVQAPDTDSRFFSRYFKRYVGRDLRVFREDFCGTFVLSTSFVQLHRENEAVCVDLDGPTGSCRKYLMGRVAQSVERRSDKAKVLGSSPSMTMTHFCEPAWRNGSASVSGAGGCGFDPHRGCVFVWCPTARPAAQRVL